MTDQRRYCLNCEAELHGEFCSSCGQRDKELHLPIKDLASEFVEILPLFNERLIRSIYPLLFKPGFLTNEYLTGKRKRYISPFKMYFVISFIYFLIGSLSGPKAITPVMQTNAGSDSVAVSNDTAFVSVSSTNSGLRFSVKDSTEVENVFGPAGMKALRNLKANPQLMFDKFMEHRSKFIFVLLPVFALLLKLLYFRSKTLYIKHLVYSFYFHSFIFCLFIVINLLNATNLSFLETASTFLYLFIPVNLYFGLRRVYVQAAWKTGVKFFLLMLLYAGAFVVAFIATFVIIIALFYL